MSRRSSLPRLSRRAFGGLALPALLGPWRAAARGLARPVVVELFTSEGCSSCPPADALLRRLAAGGGDLLPLGFHVTYWDRLGWRDPFSLPVATERQRAHARHTQSHGIYTPQIVVDGRFEAVGSDELAVGRALRDAAAAMAPPVGVRLADRDGEAIVELDAAPGRPAGRVLLIGFDRLHETAVGRGENSGRRLLEANIVRALVPLGPWQGAALRLRHGRPPGDRLAVLVEAADGTMLGAVATM